ncbi:hypothetical protein Mapa_015156 [Marchantia paleacea]|nr:hypothetical protein Mapa_015156 [Marchantia paleacea]
MMKHAVGTSGRFLELIVISSRASCPAQGTGRQSDNNFSRAMSPDLNTVVDATVGYFDSSMAVVDDVGETSEPRTSTANLSLDSWT